MKRRSLSIPELAIIAGTRAALGTGLGLLLGGFLPHERRRAVGWTLLGVGVVSTVPIAMRLFRPGGVAEMIEARPRGVRARAGRARRVARAARRIIRRAEARGAAAGRGARAHAR